MKSEFSFNKNDMETYLKYTKGLRDFLEMYDDLGQLDQMKYEDCGGEIPPCRDGKGADGLPSSHGKLESLSPRLRSCIRNWR